MCSISYIVYVVSKDFFTREEISFFKKGFIDEPNYVRSKFRQKLEGEKKKITRDAKLFRILIFRFFDITHFPSGVSHARIN